MSTFIVAFVVILLAVVAMSLGVLLSGRRIKGSCGGLNTIKGLEGSCSCESPCEKRRAREEAEKLTESRLS
ncbi:MAG: (Na+)-NQR maturation NqrM [Gammaproteobacteria bacterium]|nr:(Na+)-NQR maturation NqrM [Gammaproteobacteria bacterium]